MGLKCGQQHACMSSLAVTTEEMGAPSGEELFFSVGPKAQESIMEGTDQKLPFWADPWMGMQLAQRKVR